MPEEKAPKRLGRPPKKVVAAKAKGGRGKVGRPKGEAGIMAEYKSRMLASPKSTRVMQAVFDAALDPDHKNQAAAWKLVMERVLPVSMFEKEAGSLGQKSGGSGVTINITGIQDIAAAVSSVPSEEEEAEDGQWAAVETEDE